MQLSTLADRCRGQLAFEGTAPTTLEAYERVWRQFLHYVAVELGQKDDTRSFTADAVQGFARYLDAKGVKAATVRFKLSALSTLAVHGMRERKPDGRPRLAENPTKAFKWPKRVRPRQEFLHPDELRAFLAVECPAHHAIVRALFVDTGLRVSELCRANREDFVRMGDRYALYTTVKGRGQDERTAVPISSAVAGQLAAYLAARDRAPAPLRRAAPEPLLMSGTGARWTRTVLSEAMARLGKAAGLTRLRVSPHKLRRTSNIVARFADLDSLTRSRLLNHVDPGTIREYDAVIPGELSEARERARTVGLSRYMGPDGTADDTDDNGLRPGITSGSGE